MQRVVTVYTHLERGADDVGAAARGHDLFSGGHESRTHDAAVFQAAAATVALFKVADERPVLERERQHRLEWKFKWASNIFAQMIVDPVAVILDNFSRIENAFRIKAEYELTHNLE